VQVELSQQWEQYIIASIIKWMIKRICSSYRGTLLLPTTYKIIYGVLLSVLPPYVDEMTGDHLWILV